MKARTTVIGGVLFLISLPVVFALVSAVTFYTRNRSNGVIVSAGEKREYLLHVPASYDSTKPTPLVISMHGGAASPALQMDLSGWSRLAEKERFIVVYPAATKYAGVRGWQVSQSAGLMRDVRFISDLIESLSTEYNIDPSRIYANGLSNGGGMAFVLSCTLSDRIAAVGMVAACHTLPWSWCTDQRPVPMIAFHGTADPITPYHGGKVWVTPRKLPDIAIWAASWARRNRCQANPIDSVMAADVTRSEYTSCAEDAAVVLYTIRGGGHSWPGSEPLPEWFAGPTSDSIDATSLMWAFFREHQLGTPAVCAAINCWSVRFTPHDSCG
jgi:polyhydroxybutyrate depolymerase